MVSIRTYNNETYFVRETEIPREKTLSVLIRNYDDISADKVFAFFKNLNQLEGITCIQKITEEKVNIYEVTFRTESSKEECQQLLTNTAQELQIDGKKIEITRTKPLKDYVKVPVTRVLIYECPYELPDSYIIDKLKNYGLLLSQQVDHHKFRGTEIHNGVRSINFTEIVNSIPTTLYVKGNRIKLKHIGQDRTPVCSICKEKNHYRTNCPTLRMEEEPSTWANNAFTENETLEDLHETTVTQKEENQQKEQQSHDISEIEGDIIIEKSPNNQEWKTVESKRTKRKNNHQKPTRKEKLPKIQDEETSTNNTESDSEISTSSHESDSAYFQCGQGNYLPSESWSTDDDK